MNRGLNKRGISAIVATVLIILITVAAVTIIWAAIIPMIQDNMGFADPDLRLRVVTSEGYTFYDESAQKLYVQVVRGADESDVVGMNIIVSTAGTSETFEYGSTYVPQVNQFSTIIIGDVAVQPDSVRAVPLVMKGTSVRSANAGSDVEIDTGTESNDRTPTPQTGETDTVPNPILTGLVSWWNMEEVSGSTVSDSHSSNDGIAMGDAVQTDDGKWGKGFAFDGDGDYVNMGDDSSLAPVNMSAFLWVNANDWDSATANALLHKRVSNTEGYFFWVSPSDSNVYIDVDNGGQDRFDTNYVAPTGEWVYIGYTYDGHYVRFYVNGILDATSSDFDKAYADSGTDLIIGSNGAAYYLHGTLDEVMIWNRALNSSEVLSLYNNPLS